MLTFSCIAEAVDTISANQSALDAIEDGFRALGVTKPDAFGNPKRHRLLVRFDVAAASIEAAAASAEDVLLRSRGTLAALGGGGWRLRSVYGTRDLN